MKKLATIFVTLMILIISVGCNKQNQEPETQINRFEQEYEVLNGEKSASGKEYPKVDIDANNLMVYATMDDLKELFENKKSGVVYFGYPECPWCRNAVPNLIKAIKRTALDKIYYLNVHDMRDTWIYEDGKTTMTKEGTEDYYQILKWLDSILDNYVVKDNNGNETKLDEKRLYVPTVVFVKDGNIVGYHMDTVESQEDPYVELTEEQKEELQGIYEQLTHKVLDDLCDESC